VRVRIQGWDTFGSALPGPEVSRRSQGQWLKTSRGQAPTQSPEVQEAQTTPYCGLGSRGADGVVEGRGGWSSAGTVSAGRRRRLSVFLDGETGREARSSIYNELHGLTPFLEWRLSRIGSLIGD